MKWHGFLPFIVVVAGALSGCEMSKKIGQVIADPGIQVGKQVNQPSEITVTMLTEPDTNINESGEATSIDVQLIYMSDDSQLQAADYDLIATTPLDEALGKNYIDHQDFSLLPDSVKTLPAIKLDEKTRFIGVVAYFSDDQTSEWKQVEAVESIGRSYHLLVHIRDNRIEMKKEDD